MKKDIGSGMTFSEYKKVLDHQMNNCILQEIELPMDSIMEQDHIEEMEEITGTKFSDVSDQMVGEITKIMLAVNKQLSNQEIYLKGRKAHLEFVFNTSMKVFEQILQKVD